MPQWIDQFDEPKGQVLGLIGSVFYFPAVITPFIASYFGDRIGRRLTLLVACLVSCAGALLNTFAKTRAELIAARAIMGAALGVQSTIGPPLMQEISHPRLRAGCAALWFTSYQFGTIVAAWVCYGTLDWQNEWAWRLPTLFQCLGTGAIAIFTFCGFMPESPRYLVKNGKEEVARTTLAKYHANGEEQDPLVEYEMAEIKHGLEIDAQTSTTYFDLFKTPGNRKRLFVLCFIAISGQWAGNALVSYYLPLILKTVNITDPHQVQGINGGLAIFSTINSAIWAQFTERWGRRPLWLTCMIGVTACFVVITALSGSFDSTQNKATGIALVPFLYLYFMFYNAGWITCGALYTTEILPYGIRTKALSVYVTVQTLCIAFNSYVNPVGMENIGWKYYIVFIVLDCIWVVICYFFMIETKGYTLEEVTRLFDGKDQADNTANTGHQELERRLSNAADIDRKLSNADDMPKLGRNDSEFVEHKA
jgi:sugar porter (SP) family MFS transporter